MSIVFATNLSARATLAGDVAARLSRALEERLVVLHVARPGDDVEELEREVTRLEGFSRAELAVRLGPVVETAEAFARDMTARYVVVGAQGRGLRPLLGTTASALAARVAVPLLVVRAGERLLPFFDDRATLRVLMTHGRDASFVAQRDALIELSRIGPIEATVAWAPEDPAPLTADARAAIERELRESIGPVPGVDVRVQICDGAGDVIDRLLAAVRAQPITLVVCGTHQRRGLSRALLGSTASVLLRDAPCSVLVAPMQGAS